MLPTRQEDKQFERISLLYWNSAYMDLQVCLCAFLKTCGLKMQMQKRSSFFSDIYNFSHVKPYMKSVE